ncbi:hypothetical protein RCL1_001105 [Eukaryota sp. TZLM3-RCL]
MNSIQVYLYDLSMGMAKTLSPMFLGPENTLEMIPHTSIVVFGQEYWFGQGIQHCAPGYSYHGTPVQVLNFGSTEIPLELFNEWLQTARVKFSDTSYHLLELNCNHFTNEALEFLAGINLPSDIVDLPRKVMSTPLGQMLKPYIDQFFGNNFC